MKLLSTRNGAETELNHHLRSNNMITLSSNNRRIHRVMTALPLCSCTGLSEACWIKGKDGDTVEIWPLQSWASKSESCEIAVMPVPIMQ